MSTSRTSPPPEPWEPHLRLLTTREAAKTVDRPIGTIYRWASLGLLKPHAKQEGRPLYLESDVLKVDGDMHRRRVRVRK